MSDIKMLIWDCKRNNTSELILNDLEINYIPSEIYELNWITKLDLSSNKILELDDDIQKMENL